MHRTTSACALTGYKGFLATFLSAYLIFPRRLHTHSGNSFLVVNVDVFKWCFWNSKFSQIKSCAYNFILFTRAITLHAVFNTVSDQ